jgi:hypothetical protein
MADAILPVARGLCLCDGYRKRADGKVDLLGISNRLSANVFPFDARISLFAQLVNGLGKVPFFIDVRRAKDDALVRTTATRNLAFPDRHAVVQVAVTIESCRFELPGIYFFELFCDNNWVCDTRIRVVEG